MASYIDDGYTRDDGYVAAPPATRSGERLWDPLSFSYRIATRSEVIRHDAEVRMALRDEENDPDCALKAEKLACEFVAKRLSTWNLKNRGHHDVSISADACARMNSGLFARLYRIIRGSDVSDPLPDATVSSPSDEDQQKN